jgi:hypothetical protein
LLPEMVSWSPESTGLVSELTRSVKISTWPSGLEIFFAVSAV